MRLTIFILFLGLFAALLSSCRKEDEIFESAEAQLNFSTDSVSFDTVFTTVGTITENFLVYNPYKETVRISSIRLQGGQNSTFRINVDGQPGPFHTDVEIAPKDSMFIFVEATVDPSNQQNPFLISDQIEFTTNGNRQAVTLIAYGQNAIYYLPDTTVRGLPRYSSVSGSHNMQRETIRWTDSLPIVVYDYVRLDSLDQLIIEEGTKIYFHNNAGLWISPGSTLKVRGTQERPVIFRGDRLQPSYDDVAGQWDRIWINEGGLHEIEYAEIRNAFLGLQVEVLPFQELPYTNIPNLSLSNVIIDNCSGFGLLSSLSAVVAENLSITDCGQYNVVCQGAGIYDFRHCTFGNYFSEVERETPAFYASSIWVNAFGDAFADSLNIRMFNSIVYGNKDNEFLVENEEDNIVFRLEHVLLKTTESTDDTTSFKDIIKNPNGEVFANPTMGEFQLAPNSPAINQGDFTIANAIPLDLKGNDRTADGQADLGAYEYQP